MDTNHNKLLFFLLIIGIFFSGMYPALFRADSFSVGTKNLPGEALIYHPDDGEPPEIPACTAKMLGVRGLRAPQVFGRAAFGIGQKQERQFFVCLFLGLALFYFFCFHITGKTWRFQKLPEMAVVLDYIHKMDGKK